MDKQKRKLNIKGRLHHRIQIILHLVYAGKVDEWESLSTAVFSGRIAPSIEVFLSSLPNYGVMPKTLTLKKMKEKGFYKIYGHNEALDEIPKIN